MEIDKRLIVLLKRSADEIKKTVIGKDDIIIKILMYHKMNNKAKVLVVR